MTSDNQPRPPDRIVKPSRYRPVFLGMSNWRGSKKKGRRRIQPSRNSASESSNNSEKRLASALALLAAIVPITAGITGCFQLNLDREKYRSEVNIKYLDRAIDPNQQPAYRESVLSFLVETTDRSQPLHSWALARRGEIREVLEGREAIKKLNADLTRSLADLELEKAGRLEAQKDLTEKEQELQRQAMEMRKTLEAAQESLAASEKIAATPPPPPLQVLPLDHPELLRKVTATSEGSEFTDFCRLELSPVIVSQVSLGKSKGNYEFTLKCVFLDPRTFPDGRGSFLDPKVFAGGNESKPILIPNTDFLVEPPGWETTQ